MSFAAIAWCKRAILLIAIICYYRGKTTPALSGEINSQGFDFKYSSLQVNYQKEYSQSSQQRSSCQEINHTYSQVYSFETDYHHINICQQEDDYYYHRQSKLNPTRNTIIPAKEVFRGGVFQATSGKIIYFAGKDSDRYYSSVMLNNNEIILEPELLPTPTSFDQDIVNSRLSFSFGDITLNNITPTTNANWQSESSQNSDASLVCVKDSSILNPSLDNWQKLLGKSPDTANKYATNNGHNFVYDDVFPDRALIETKEGKIINLNIATTNELIEQICIQPTEDI